MNTTDLIGKSLAILGYGTEGKSTYKRLLNQGVASQQITIRDQNDIVGLPDGANAVCGEDYLVDLTDHDFIFRSPGLTDHLLQQQLPEGSDRKEIRGRMSSQTEIFFERYRGKVIGITGTKGKTTISTLVYEFLKTADKKVALVGNVGLPVLDQIDFDHPPEFVVYELSSFMIDALDEYTVDIGVFNTFYETHTAEHGGMDAYRDAKAKLLLHADQVLIGSQLQETVGTLPTEIQQRVTTGEKVSRYGYEGAYTFDDQGFKVDDAHVLGYDQLQLPGEHNKYNLCAIIGIADVLGLSYEDLGRTLATFTGVQHRICTLGVYQGITWVDDAIATTPQATIAAIKSFDNVNTLFFGGIVGTYDFTELAECINNSTIRHIILFPDSGQILKQLLDKEDLEIYETRSMDEAVKRAYSVTEKNTIALLSSGSPSFSLWTGFMAKAKEFGDAVKKYSNG